MLIKADYRAEGFSTHSSCEVIKSYRQLSPGKQVAAFRHKVGDEHGGISELSTQFVKREGLAESAMEGCRYEVSEWQYEVFNALVMPVLPVVPLDLFVFEDTLRLGLKQSYFSA